jgi:hypothetical protein
MLNRLALHRIALAPLAVATLVVAVPASAQQAVSGRLVTPGSFADDSARTWSITSAESPSYPLLRSASTLTQRLPGPRDSLRVRILLPEVYAIYNSALPYSLNDGALWAGRGFSYRVRGGLVAELGSLRLVLAPEVFGTENQSFEMPNPRVVLPRPPGRDSLSSPWYRGPQSIDLPIRFGTNPYSALDFGQSTLEVRLGKVALGLSTENEWWGPGIRNAIVMSTNAAGIPRLFLRTARPIVTRAGTFDVRLFGGGLEESAYFDSTAANDLRSISAVAVAWTPPGAPNVTVGLTRAVYAPVSDWGHVPIRLLDALWRDPGRPNDHLPGDTVVVPGPDQVYSLFGRWAFPGAGFEMYAEWARTELPVSIRDLLTAPNHTQGYTLGMQWARPVRSWDVVRVQLEMTYLGKDATLADRPVATWYTSRAVPQGYTNQGQVLGAAIGPGASSQWLAVDYIAPRWQAGLFASRIRWNGEALYTFPTTNFGGVPNKWCSHDTSVLFGVRGAFHAFSGLLQLSYDLDQRLNVFFHNLSVCGQAMDPRDVQDALNHTITVRFTPP